MTPITSSKSPWGYEFAQKVYKFPTVMESFIKSKNPDSRLTQSLAGFLKNQLNMDYHHFTRAELGGTMKTMLSEPPRGALLFLLYPGTVGPRLYRAWQRGKENNDYREVWDVLRRDGTAITLFVYALPVIVNAASQFMQHHSKINLIDTNSKKVLNYSQFHNYEIDNPKVLQQILHEGNGEALRHATRPQALKKLAASFNQDSKTYQTLTELPSTINKLVDFYNEHTQQGQKDFPSSQTSQLEALSQKAHGYFETAEDLLKKDGHPELKGKVKGLLRDYAKTRRLPADILSFACVIGLIGWFPVWFNSVLNKRSYEKKNNASTKQHATPTPPTASSSRTLSNHPFSLPPGQPIPATTGMYAFQGSLSSSGNPFRAN